MRKKRRMETPEHYARTILGSVLDDMTGRTSAEMLEAFYREIRRRYYDFHQEASNESISPPPEDLEGSSS